MKLTWFGGTAFRIHIGGQIIVVDAEQAIGVDSGELVSGADIVTAMDAPHKPADGTNWTARPIQRLLDADESLRPAQIWTLGEGALLVDADEDRPLLLLAGEPPALGRWVEKAVVVMAGDDLARRGAALLESRRPHLIAFGGSDAARDQAFSMLPPLLDGAGLIALEPGLAVEV
ncbi:MAG: hypothetical protein KIT02_03970 [Devosia sp.]|uniref:hypothetical protein n=1 Tax=Devosia sp. TaxID=1871048 RepID=UPI0024CD89BC|nr:hypothetical protein [Devosia sp.]UYO00385.1 MAG: hypothetical protein KIT02_03970 [Devosia sp.]